MLLLVQPDPDVPSGAYADYLHDAGVPFRTIRLFAAEPLPVTEEAKGVIVLGGAMGVHDSDRFPFLLPLKRFMQDCTTAGLPLLGICLGGQLLADACGAVVTADSCGELGSRTVTLSPDGIGDPLFLGIPDEFRTFQWHNDSFAIPPGTVRLAFSNDCPNQAFRVGDNGYGVQFHPEVTPAIVRQWAGNSRTMAGRSEELLADFTRHVDSYNRDSRQLLLNFLAIARLL